MTGLLTNQLIEVERLVTQISEGRFLAALFDTGQANTRTLFRKIELAWQQAEFSDVDDDCVKRYFNFHLKKINDLSEQLSGPVLLADTPDQEKLRSDLQQGLALLTGYLLHSHGAFVEGSATLSGAYQRHWHQKIKPRTEALTRQFSEAAINVELRECLLTYIHQYEPDSEQCRICPRAVFYFDLVISRLSALDFQVAGAEDRINAVLCELNFNHLLYLNYWQEKLAQTVTGKNASETLRHLKDELHLWNIRPEQNRYVYHPDWPSLRIMVSTYIREEISRYTEKQQAFGQPDQNQNCLKIPLNLSVAQLACLIWLCYEEGFFAAGHLTDIFKVFSYSFSSKKQDRISAGSLSKEFYSISQVTAAVMREKLSKMTIRINRNFFPA